MFPGFGSKQEYRKMYVNTFGNFNKMDKFLEKISKLTQNIF